MHICLISSAHLSANPRLVKEADALSEAGYEVTVIAATYDIRSREVDHGFESRPWRAAPPIPFGPRARRGRRLVQIARLGLSGMAARAGVRHPAVLRGALHPVTTDLAAAALGVRADLYIAHLAALPAAALAARRHGGRYAFDAEDFHTGELSGSSKDSALRQVTSALERLYLPGCAYVTAASPGIAEAYEKNYGIARPTTILNVFPLSESPVRATPRGAAAPEPSVYWFSQTIGPDRGLEAAVRAIALAASRPHLYLRGAASRGFASRLSAVAAEAGVADRLHILTPAAPDEMARLAAQYDLGLAGETGHTLNRRIALTNKLFTYLLAGLPIVASDVEAHRAFAPEMGEAMRLHATDDPGSLAGAIDAYLTDPAKLSSARATAFALGQARFNWDLEKAKLVARVAQALAT